MLECPQNQMYSKAYQLGLNGISLPKMNIEICTTKLKKITKTKVPKASLQALLSPLLFLLYLNNVFASEKSLDEANQIKDVKFVALEQIDSTSFSSPVEPSSIASEEIDELAPIYRHEITNSLWENLAPETNFYDNPYQVSIFSAENGEDSERLWSQTKSVFAYGFGVIGVLYVMPASITNWDKDQGDFIKWTSNVKEGPLWDRDNMPINYIGHPYFGSVYYQVARKSGYRQWDAFLYGFLMSSFYWEYGIEAIAEIPSVQDLVVTPVLGWVWGEWAFNQEQELRQSGGTIWGSEFLGSTALVLLDPIDSAGRGINNLFGHQVIKAGTGYISMNDRAVNRGQNGSSETESYVELNVSFSFGSGARGTGPAPTYYNYSKDPVDYGVVGISYGTGYVDAESDWGYESGSTILYSLGVYFSREFSARVSYTKGKLSELATGEGLHYENYSLDGQYYFNTENDFRPYLTAGIGEVLRDRDNELKVFEVNAGLGLHYKINNNFALQSDIRQYYSTNAKKGESALALHLVYRFGKGEWY